MPIENQNVIRKHSKLGIIGFVLAVVGYMFTGILTLLPALIICVIAVFRKANRILAVIGILLCFFWLTYLAAPELAFPNPYGIIQFANNFKAACWLGFDPICMKNGQGAYWFFGGSGGALRFTSKPGYYNRQDVIKFAKDHGWKYEGESTLSSADFRKFIDAKNKVRYLDIEDYYRPNSDYDVNDFNSVQKIYETEKKKTDVLRNASMNSFPFWIQSDCEILLFDTNNPPWLSSVFISSDGSSLAVYYNGTR